MVLAKYSSLLLKEDYKKFLKLLGMVYEHMRGSISVRIDLNEPFYYTIGVKQATRPAKNILVSLLMIFTTNSV